MLSSIGRHALGFGIVVAAFVVILNCCTKVQAADADTINDLRCVIVGAELSASPDSSQKFTAAMLMSYYLGRLSGRSPSLDVEDLIRREIVRMTPADFTSETRRCNNALAAKGKEVGRIGEDLARLRKR